MTDRIVIITGGRDLADPRPVEAFLERELAQAVRCNQWLMVYHGACPTGADHFAERWWSQKPQEAIGRTAFWPNNKLPSPARYHERNRRMVAKAVEMIERLDCVVTAGAFPGAGNGTRTVIKLLAKAGIETVVVELGKMPPEPEDELRLRALAKRDGFRGL